MMTQGLEFTDIPPFKDILIHGIVRDSQGRKMSKTLGNGIDPLDIIEKYGTDSLRFSLLSGTTMGNDIRFMEEKLEQGSNFANKIWNAARFIIMNLVSAEEIKEYGNQIKNKEKDQYNSECLKIEDRWIIHRLDQLIADVTKNIENYDLGVALDNIYNFIWNEFCDWYIEIAKSRLYSEDRKEKIQVGFVLNYVFGDALKLLHPFMPFITSEIYKELVNYSDKDLMISSWPKSRVRVKYNDKEDFIKELKEIIIGIRNVRANMNVHPSKKSKLIFITEKYQKEIKESQTFIERLGFANEILIKVNKEDIPENAISVLGKGMEVYIPFEELVDTKEEIERLEKEKQRLEGEVQRSNKMLSNPGFVSKAPESKIQEEKDKLEKYQQMLILTKERLNKLNK